MLPTPLSLIHAKRIKHFLDDLVAIEMLASERRSSANSAFWIHLIISGMIHCLSRLTLRWMIWLCCNRFSTKERICSVLCRKSSTELVFSAAKPCPISSYVYTYTYQLSSCHHHGMSSILSLHNPNCQRCEVKHT